MMTRRTVAALLTSGFALVAVSVHASPGDPRTVQGTLAWASDPGADPFIIVRADDGRQYFVDLSAARRMGGGPPGVGDRISVVGMEGRKFYEIRAVAVGAGDTALSASPPSASAPSPGSPATAPRPTAHSPAANPARPDRSTFRIHGRIASLSGRTLRVRDLDGRLVTVDVSQMSATLEKLLLRDEDVTVFAVPDAQGGLVAVGFVQAERASPSALTRDEGPSLPPR